MSLPSVSPQGNFTCFSCSQEGVKPFSKIFRGHWIYHVCKSECLAVALNRLGLFNSDDRSFTSPVNITVQSANSRRSPLNRSPGVLNLSGGIEDEDIDLKQIQQFGKQKELDHD